MASAPTSTFSARSSSRAVTLAPSSLDGSTCAARVDARFKYTASAPARKDRVAYFYDDDVSTIHYGKRHPMKPQRMTLTHELVYQYGLFDRMELFEPRLATEEELKAFHVSDYVDFLRTVTPDNQTAFKDLLERFNMNDDCPVFSDLYKFCRISAGGSIDAGRRLNDGVADIAINWSGGLHHAKKVEASGFCYVNDIVLCIMELLRVHPRVVYIDIDVHHGDGVQEAFYKSDRVMTVSFHRFGPERDDPKQTFFPGTGGIDETGHERGEYYSVNVPLKAGMDDASYVELFKAVMRRVMDVYRPGAVVLQCGADSLGCDRLGQFCLSIAGHGQCVEYMKSFGVPLVVLGGGGYTIRNVARCWAHETGLLVDAALPNVIPPHAYKEFYGPDFKLHPRIADQMRNENSPQYIERIREKVYEHLRNVEHAPSVQMQQVPPSMDGLTDEGARAERDRLAENAADVARRLRERPGLIPGRDRDWYDGEEDHDDDDDDPDAMEGIEQGDASPATSGLLALDEDGGEASASDTGSRVDVI